MGSEIDSRSYQGLQTPMRPCLSTKHAITSLEPPASAFSVAVMDGLASPGPILAKYPHRRNCKGVVKSAHISKRPSLGRFVTSSLNGSLLAPIRHPSPVWNGEIKICSLTLVRVSNREGS